MPIEPGPQGVIERIMWLLQDRMPDKLVELRDRRGLHPDQLEDIETWLTSEPESMAIDQAPAVVVVIQETDTLTGPNRSMQDGRGGSVYRFRYRVAIIAFGRGTSFEDVSATTLGYGLAVREILLQTPGLGDPDPDALQLVPRSLLESYSEVFRNASSDAVAGVGVTVFYESSEVIPARLPGRAATGGGVGINPTP